MTVEPCEFEGLKLIRPTAIPDRRGWFFEVWNRNRFAEAGIHHGFVQENLSFSRRGTLRGLHFQNPNAQAKLVTVVQGEVFDVVVDLRRGSPTFRQWTGMRLTAESQAQLYVPPGFAHGFQAMSGEVLFLYMCSEAYQPSDAVFLRWDDPDLGIGWPIPEPILSEKDANALCLSQIPEDRLFP